MSVDFSTLDKSTFTCFRLSPTSYYYGETIPSLLSPPSSSLPPPSSSLPPPSSSNPLPSSAFLIPSSSLPLSIPPPSVSSIIRNGLGIQYNILEEDYSVYEGTWQKDNRHGYGKCRYCEDEEYVGEFKNDLRDGEGEMVWKEGWRYKGEWKEGRINGRGIFWDKEGNKMEGKFKNDCYLTEEGIFINVFFQKSYTEEKSLRLEQHKSHEKKKGGIFEFDMTDNAVTAREFIDRSNENERIPLVCESNLREEGLEEEFRKILGEKFQVFNLRQAANLRENKAEYAKFMLEIKEKLAKSLIEGDYFIINIDDYQSSNYDENYDVNIREFYDSQMFPSHIFEYKIMMREEVFNKILEKTQYLGAKSVKKLKVSEIK